MVGSPNLGGAHLGTGNVLFLENIVNLIQLGRTLLDIGHVTLPSNSFGPTQLPGSYIDTRNIVPGITVSVEVSSNWFGWIASKWRITFLVP